MPYSIQDRFTWIHTTDEEILTATQGEKTHDHGEMCYLSRRIIHTTHDTNASYHCIVYSLENPLILEKAYTHEEGLLEHEKLIIHRVAIIRDGVMIDKTGDLTVRVLDNESSSNEGMIYHAKKVNILIEDLRRGDILVYEVTHQEEVSYDTWLEEKYFYYNHVFPTGYWKYKNLEFTIINERKDTIIGKSQFVRPDQVQLPSNSRIEIASGERYTTIQKDYQEENMIGLSAGIEFATETSWEEIVRSIVSRVGPTCREILSIEDLKTIVDFSSPKEDQIRQVIEFIQNDIHYVYDANFTRSHIPVAPPVTFARRSGDCKAKAVLMRTVFEMIGVVSHILVVNYKNDPLLPFGLPSPFLFDHMIIRVYYNDEVYYVDPTWKNESGYLPYRREPIFEYFLPMLDRGSTLSIRTMRIDDEPSIDDTIHIELQNKSISYSMETTYRKDFAEKVRADFHYLPKEGLITAEDDWVKESIRYRHTPLGASSKTKFEILSDNRDTNILKTLFLTEVENPYDQSEGGNIFHWRPHDITLPSEYLEHIGYFLLFPSMKRRVEIYSDQPLKSVEGQEYSLKVDNPFFSYSQTETFRDENHVVIETIYIPRTMRRLTLGEYTQVKKDIDRIEVLENGGSYLLGEKKVSWIEQIRSWIH